MNIYYSQTCGMIKRLDIWKSMDVVPVEYGIIYHTFNLAMCLFNFINGINFRWDYFLWRVVDTMVWVGILNTLRIYRVPPDPVKWSCRDSIYLCQAFRTMWMLPYNKYINMSHRYIWELPGNYPDFIRVMVFYLFFWRSMRIIVTAVFVTYYIYIH